MSFTVCATVDGHRVSAPAETAKEAFAKALKWQVAQQFADVAISDGNKDYSIAEFSAKMALAEITVTGRSFDSF
jgi:phosphopantetheinyl transferase (holo-ACP synthase)